MTTTYDHEGLNTLTAGSDALVTAFEYNGRGQTTFFGRGNDVDTSYTYFDEVDNFRLNRALTYDTVPGPGNELLDLRYTYDNVGNVNSILEEESSDNQQFTYDHRDRLYTAAATGGPANYSHSYNYDKLGNIQNVTKGGASYSYSYDTAQPHAVTEVFIPGAKGGASTPVFDFGYDANGNMTTRQDLVAGVTYSQTFDVENRLVTVTASNSETVTRFEYDANGLRTKTTVEPIAYPPDLGEQRTITYYPFPNYEKEVRATWQDTVKGEMWVSTATIYRSTYLAGGQIVAIRVSGDPVSGNNGLFYYHGDHLNSATFLTTTSGSKKSGTTRFYTPFGETRLGGGNGITDRGFTSHFHEDDLELVYMQARWYLAELGRFISADTIIPRPADPQSHNRYSYTVNRPVVLVDPSGHNYCSDPDEPCPMCHNKVRQISTSKRCSIAGR